MMVLKELNSFTNLLNFFFFCVKRNYRKICKEVLQALAEIVKTHREFLKKESGEKLSLRKIHVIEQKLNEAKMKCEQLTVKAEQSKKELYQGCDDSNPRGNGKGPYPEMWCSAPKAAENDEALQGFMLPAVRRSKHISTD